MIEEDDDFCDNDAQQVQVKSLQNIIRNALQLLSQMTSSGSDSEQTGTLALTMAQFFKKFEKISKQNSATGLSSLNRFTHETLFKVLDTLLTNDCVPLQGVAVLEILKLLQNVARMYFRYSAKQNLSSYFDPDIW